MLVITTHNGDGTGNNPERVRARGTRKKILDRSTTLGLAQLHLVGLVPPDAVEILRQRDELRAGRGSRRDEPRRCFEVRRELRRRHHLQRRNAGLQGLTGCVVCAAVVTLSTFGSIQLPDTWNS